MGKLLQYSANDGSDVIIEVRDNLLNEPTRGGSYETETRGIIENAKQGFNDALKPIKDVSDGIIKCIKEISNSPQQVEVELGFKFTAKAGIILTSLDSEAHFKIVFTWKKEDLTAMKPGP